MHPVFSIVSQQFFQNFTIVLWHSLCIPRLRLLSHLTGLEINLGTALRADKCFIQVTFTFPGNAISKSGSKDACWKSEQSNRRKSMDAVYGRLT